ncbi:hypothetical protein [Leucothrix pacifica]|uniref:Uncharacterized protein n=1 Tax=Leucothrix pacifica TaxID=1247513 RepID=A0A317CGL1_9GAMM|nr:hypothetical protein [Leucothrix pacifica]PWQ97658.1 hypothetical protein DKW60_09765 [Leucothrix pacifica]
MKRPIKQLISALSVSLLCSASIAEEVAESHRINPANVLSVISNDWNNDGGMDRAVLVAPTDMDDDAGLYIYLSDAASPPPQLNIFKPNLAWSGILWGTIPRLALGKSGSIEVHSMNEAIGRNRWTQKLTIAYRDGAFVVAGYTYESYDTLDLNYAFSCDINLLSGNGFKNKKPVKVSQPVVKLADWSDQSVPEVCRAE